MFLQFFNEFVGGRLKVICIKVVFSIEGGKKVTFVVICFLFGDNKHKNIALKGFSGSFPPDFPPKLHKAHTNPFIKLNHITNKCYKILFISCFFALFYENVSIFIYLKVCFLLEIIKTSTRALVNKPKTRKT